MLATSRLVLSIVLDLTDNHDDKALQAMVGASNSRALVSASFFEPKQRQWQFTTPPVVPFIIMRPSLAPSNPKNYFQLRD
jgi:hypothetical protein